MTTTPPEQILDQLKNLLEIVSNHSATRRNGDERLDEQLEAFLGCPPRQVAVLVNDVPGHRYVDHDLALQLLAERDPGNQLIGVGGGDQRYHCSLADLMQQPYGWPVSVAPPDFTVLPDSPTSERSCVGLGVRLFSYQGTPVAVMIREANPRRGQDQGSLEVLCPDRALGKELLTELGELSLRHSVLRGQLISLKESGYEQTARGVTFLPRPQVSAEDVILPAGRLDHVKEHVLGIASHAQQLRAAGQHLKRGVLLYGPPGTGKTHTLRHLLTEATDHTVVVLSGQSLACVGMAAKIARALQPSIVVLEDVDLVAGERDFSAGAQPLLFEVMDAMDGLDGDADVTFLLTTNRVEAMEDALTQRPGRVDLAVEVPLPDLAGRIQLLQLYAPADAFSHAEIERTATRLEGTTASLAKELVRRCVLMATIEGSQLGDDQLRRATEQMLDDSQELSRVLLGAGRPEPAEAPSWGTGLQPPR